ncbi:hypothetical protein [Desulfocicer niacini]
MIRKLAAINITYSVIIALVTLLMGGVVFSYFPTHQKAIDGLNTTLVHQWLFHNISSNPLVTVWVVMICVASGILFINALCCSMTSLVSAAIKHSSIKRWSFLFMHLLFLVVLVCHGLALISGHKTQEIELYAGDSHALINGFSLKAEQINFVDETRLISMKMKKSRKLMTRKTFHADKNTATVTLLKAQTTVKSQKVMMLKPLVHDGMRITLTRFLLKKNGESSKINGNSFNEKAPNIEKENIGAVFILSRNNFTALFFIAYGLLILTIIIYIRYAHK